MKPLLLVTIVLLGAIGLGWYLQSRSVPTGAPVTQTVDVTPSQQAPPTPAVVDQRAAFAIFTNGTFRVFTAAMYHNRSADVYIDAANPNVIKIKKAGVTWGDFFRTLPMQLTRDCLITGTKQTFCTTASRQLQFYLNSQPVEEALNQVIAPGDKLLVTYGNEADEAIAEQLQSISEPTD